MGDYHTSTTCNRPKIKIDNNSILIFDDLDRQCTQFFMVRKAITQYCKELYQFLSNMNPEDYCFYSHYFAAKPLIYYKLLLEGFQLLLDAYSHLAHTCMILLSNKSTKLQFLFQHYKNSVTNMLGRFEEVWVQHRQRTSIYNPSTLALIAGYVPSPAIPASNSGLASPVSPNLNRDNNNNRNIFAQNNFLNNPAAERFPFMQAMLNAQNGVAPVMNPNPQPQAQTPTLSNSQPNPTPSTQNSFVEDRFVIQEMKTLIRDLKLRMKDYQITVQCEIINENATSSSKGKSMTLSQTSSGNARRRSNFSDSTEINLKSGKVHNHKGNQVIYQDILNQLQQFTKEEKDQLLGTFFGNAFGGSSKIYTMDL